jgi:hypothetical protein
MANSRFHFARMKRVASAGLQQLGFVPSNTAAIAAAAQATSFIRLSLGRKRVTLSPHARRHSGEASP